MSQFKLLMLAFLTIGCGFCTNSVIAQMLELPPGDWAMNVVAASTPSVRATTFGAQIVTPSKAGSKKVGRAASRTPPTQHFTAPARTTTPHPSQSETRTAAHH